MNRIAIIVETTKTFPKSQMKKKMIAYFLLHFIFSNNTKKKKNWVKNQTKKKFEKFEKELLI